MDPPGFKAKSGPWKGQECHSPVFMSPGQYGIITPQQGRLLGKHLSLYQQIPEILIELLRSPAGPLADPDRLVQNKKSIPACVIHQAFRFFKEKGKVIYQLILHDTLIQPLQQTVHPAFQPCPVEVLLLLHFLYQLIQALFYFQPTLFQPLICQQQFPGRRNPDGRQPLS